MHVENGHSPLWNKIKCKSINFQTHITIRTIPGDGAWDIRLIMDYIKWHIILSFKNWWNAQAWVRYNDGWEGWAERFRVGWELNRYIYIYIIERIEKRRERKYFEKSIFCTSPVKRSVNLSLFCNPELS